MNSNFEQYKKNVHEFRWYKEQKGHSCQLKKNMSIKKFHVDDRTYKKYYANISQ